MNPGTGSAAASGTWTVLRLMTWSGSYLDGKGVERGRLEAEHLLAHVLGVERLQLYLQFDRPLTATELDRFRPLLRRRAAREPLQYILGRAAFRELELAVDPRVLIPRPETEVLVEEVLAWAREQPSGRLRALDVGTGSGAVALSLAREGPFGEVVAVDSSPEALEVARANATSCDAGETVRCLRSSLFDALPGERFDVVVSNPPYVAESDRDHLAPEVAVWEPAAALFAGPDGLDVLRRLVAEAPDHLRPGGLLAVEVGWGQAGTVAEFARATGAFDEVRVRPDLSGRERIVLAVRSVPARAG